MTYTSISVLGLISCLLLTLARLAPAQPELSKSAREELAAMELETQHAGGNVYAIFGGEGTIGVLSTEGGVVLVDAKFESQTKTVTEHVNRINNGPIEYLINTHWHMDHTGANANFAKLGAVIIAHDKVRDRLSSPQWFVNATRNTMARARDALPHLTYSEKFYLYFGEPIHVYHIENAHTDSDSLVHFLKSNVIHMGDLFFPTRYPFIHIESGGSINGLIRASEKALDLSDSETVFISGHGPLAGLSKMRKYLDMLKESKRRVQNLISRGLNLIEIMDRRPLQDFDEEWGWGYTNQENFLNMVHASMTGASYLKHRGRPR